MTTNCITLHNWLLAAFFAVVLSGQILAQSTVKTDSLPPFSRDFTVGLTVLGTTALPGLDVATRLNRRFDLRLGYNFMDHTLRQNNVAIRQDSEQRYNLREDLRLSNLSLMTDFIVSPGRKGKFRLSAGAMFFFKNSISGSFELAGNAKVHDVELSPDEVGRGTFTIKYKGKIAPYLGIGFGRIIPKRRLSCSFDIGTYYQSNPDVEIEGTELLSENDRNEPALERNLKSQPFWLAMALRIGYKI